MHFLRKHPQVAKKWGFSLKNRNSQIFPLAFGDSKIWNIWTLIKWERKLNFVPIKYKTRGKLTRIKWEAKWKIPITDSQFQLPHCALETWTVQKKGSVKQACKVQSQSSTYGNLRNGNLRNGNLRNGNLRVLHMESRFSRRQSFLFKPQKNHLACLANTA